MAMVVLLIFFAGALLGALAGSIACVRYVRQEMTANIAPGLRRLQFQVDSLETEIRLTVTEWLVEMTKRHKEPPPTLPGRS
jgi:hypothetical protein